MSTFTEPRASTALPELASAMSRFEVLGRDLVSSYRSLTLRAERVEQQLAIANRELERKVVELDSVSGELEALLSALPTGVVVRADNGDITRTNPAAAQILGSGSAEGLDSRAQAVFASLAAVEPSVHRIAIDGTPRAVATRRAPVPARDGPSAAEVFLLDDQTEHLRLVARLHTVDKMAALGTLAAGVAHEIRNPLSAVLGFASLLVRELPQDSRARRWAELIVRGASETDEIVGGLLTFAGPGNVAPEPFEIDILIHELVDQARARSARPERWELVAPPSGARLVADRVKLRQALRNLIANAMDAQPRGGRVEVRVRTDREGVALIVCDNGPGVPAELRTRVLEPFFTTRAEGTGLGLALTHTVARLHGGRLDVDAACAPLRGAAFTLQLPPECLLPEIR